MKELINFAVNLLEKENGIISNPKGMPSQNHLINPTQNPKINSSQNPKINSSQNTNISPSQNSNWKRNQWELFEETILFRYLNNNQKDKCKNFLNNL